MVYKMNNKTLLYMIIGVVTCLSILLFINTFSFVLEFSPEKYLSPNNVQGIAVEHKGKLYTLNFQQQNDFITYINKAFKAGNSITPQPSTAINKIIIYPFNKSDIQITVYGYIGDDLIFSTPAWHSNELLQDKSEGALKKLLSQTYDP